MTLIDTETTGVSVDDRVCEVAWMHLDETFEIIEQGCSLINPGIPIDPAASAVNGITDDMVTHAPTLDEYMEDAGLPLMRANVLVAHNIPFDYRFLKPYCNPEAEHLCTLKCARVLYPEASNHKQSTLAYTLGLHMDRAKAHSADGDLMVLAQLLLRMCADARTNIRGLLELQAQPRVILKMPFGKHKGTPLSELPTSYIRWLLDKANIDDDLRLSLMSL